MAWTTPPTFVASDPLAAAELNILGDDLVYLKGITDGVSLSGVQLSRVTNQSVNDSTTADITWTAESFDFGGWWSTGTTATVPAGAIPSGFTTIAILCFGRLQYAANGTGIRRIRLLKNGTYFGSRTVGAPSGDVTDVQITEMTTVAAGDLLTVEAYQTSGGALNVVESNITWVRYAPAA